MQQACVNPGIVNLNIFRHDFFVYVHIDLLLNREVFLGKSNKTKEGWSKHFVG